VKSIIVFIVILLYSTPVISPAAEVTGAELLKQCKGAVNFRDSSGSTNFKVGQCLGYISGLTDTANYYYHNKKIRNAHAFCIPKEVTLGQEVMVVVKYLESHPEKRMEPRFTLVMTALTKAFPCARNSSKQGEKNHLRPLHDQHL
jgi:hypothetical protein